MKMKNNYFSVHGIGLILSPDDVSHLQEAYAKKLAQQEGCAGDERAFYEKMEVLAGALDEAAALVGSLAIYCDNREKPYEMSYYTAERADNVTLTHLATDEKEEAKDDEVGVFWANKDMSPFKAAYVSIDELAEEFLPLKELLPDNFDIKQNLCLVEMALYGGCI